MKISMPHGNDIKDNNDLQLTEVIVFDEKKDLFFSSINIDKGCFLYNSLKALSKKTIFSKEKRTRFFEKEKVKATSFYEEKEKKVYITLTKFCLKQEENESIVDFITSASHELKTPLTILKGYAETLKDFPALKESQRALVAKKIVEVSYRFESIIESLIKLSSLDREKKKKLFFQKCNLLPIIKDLKKNYFDCHAEGINIISKQENMEVLGDKDLLEMAFRNIIENSIKYSNKEPKIDIELVKLGSRISILFKDEGMGIEKKDQPYLFDKFFIGSRSCGKKVSGFGLGLSIVKKIIDLHNGRIEVISEINKGSTFTIII